MEKKNDEAIYLEAVPLEWLSEPDNQQQLRQILSDNMDRLSGNLSKRESQMVVPSTAHRRESRVKCSLNCFDFCFVQPCVSLPQAYEGQRAEN